MLVRGAEKEAVFEQLREATTDATSLRRRPNALDLEQGALAPTDPSRGQGVEVDCSVDFLKVSPAFVFQPEAKGAKRVLVRLVCLFAEDLLALGVAGRRAASFAHAPVWVEGARAE